MRTRLLILVVLVSLASGSAFTASYQRIDGTIVDPIQNVSGGDHSYRRNNLEPSAILSSADLVNADLSFATLSFANLSGASLANATNLALSGGAAFYDLDTDFTGTGFDPVAAGWTLVPEPGTALLMGLGLAGLASRRR